MRVVLITRNYPHVTCGVGDYTQGLAHYFATQGFEVAVITSKHPDLKRESQSLIRLEGIVSTWDGRGIQVALQSIKSLGPEVVDIQYVPSAFSEGMGWSLVRLLVAIRSLGNITLVLTCHEIYLPYVAPSEGGLEFSAKHNTRMSLQRVAFWAACYLAHCVVVTNERRLRLVKRHVWKRTHVAMSYIPPNIPVCPISEENKRSLRARLGIGVGDAVLMTFGKLQAAKDYEGIFEAVALLTRQGMDVHLLCVGDWKGSDPSRFERLTGLAESLRIRERMTITGRVAAETLSHYFQTSDMFLFFQKGGATTSSGTIPAAMAHGVPVIANMGPETGSFFQHGQNVWLTPSCDPKSIADAIAGLHADQALRSALGQREREDYVAYFSMNRVAERISAIYRG